MGPESCRQGEQAWGCPQAPSPPPPAPASSAPASKKVSVRAPQGNRSKDFLQAMRPAGSPVLGPQLSAAVARKSTAPPIDPQKG